MDAKLITKFLLILFIVMGYFFYSDQKAQNKDDKKELVEAIPNVAAIWRGENLKISNKLYCKELGEVDLNSDFIKCNPSFLNCYLEHLDQNGQAHVEAGDKLFFKKYGSKYYEVKSNPYRVEVTLLGSKDKSLELTLEDSCHQAYLPQRIYAYGPYSKSKTVYDWKWDNFQHEIFVDKKPVTNRDLVEWHEVTGKKLDYLGSYKRNLQAFATKISPNDMRKYCSFRQKQLLQAHVFDAATFLPRDLSKRKSDYIIRGKYHWSLRNEQTFLFKERNGVEESFKKENCSLSFTKECLRFFDSPEKAPNKMTWMGIQYALGSYMEYFDNPYKPKENIKLSSYHFKASSKYHELGVRGYWDGEGFDSKNITYKDNYIFNKEKPQITFRCMRYVSN